MSAEEKNATICRGVKKGEKRGKRERERQATREKKRGEKNARALSTSPPRKERRREREGESGRGRERTRRSVIGGAAGAREVRGALRARTLWRRAREASVTRDRVARRGGAEPRRAEWRDAGGGGGGRRGRGAGQGRRGGVAEGGGRPRRCDEDASPANEIHRGWVVAGEGDGRKKKRRRRGGGEKRCARGSRGTEGEQKREGGEQARCQEKCPASGASLDATRRRQPPASRESRPTTLASREKAAEVARWAAVVTEPASGRGGSLHAAPGQAQRPAPRACVRTRREADRRSRAAARSGRTQGDAAEQGKKPATRQREERRRGR